MQIDEEGTDYTKPSVRLVVEQQGERLVIVYANMDVNDMYNLSIEFIDRISRITGQEYNSTCEDLKEIVEGE